MSDSVLPVFRFAPSPNGLLHLGHAYSALINWDWARNVGGRFLLRIEDIDIGRARDAFVHQIEEDLAYLGVMWEEPVLRQSSRFEAYKPSIERLKEMGLLYPCFATRAEIMSACEEKGSGWPHDPDGSPLYPGLWRDAPAVDVMRMRAEGAPHAWRLNMEKTLAYLGLHADEPLSWQEVSMDGTIQENSAKPSAWGDVVLVRKDVPASYHLACVLDDAHQHITHVVRGQDIEPSTALHRLLQMCLGIEPPVYHHHDLILDEAGRKLSKSDGAKSIKALREEGVLPSEIRQRIGLS